VEAQDDVSPEILASPPWLALRYDAALHKASAMNERWSTDLWITAKVAIMVYMIEETQ
jgi:hypothetical protein